MHKKEKSMLSKLAFTARCSRPKNPCKICFQAVTKRNGLQCHGACKKWAHYTCLGYTPGKIQDIKAGLITIVCPCPDCSASPKEINNKPPVSCHEPNCPSNNYPKCDDADCPKNNCNSTFSSSLPCECVNPTVPVTMVESTNSCGKNLKATAPIKLSSKGARCKVMTTIQKSKSCSCSLDASHTDCLPHTSTKPVTCKKSMSCEPLYPCKPVSFKPVACQSFSFDQQCSPSSSVDSQANEGGKCVRHISVSVADALEDMCQTVTDLSEQIKLVISRLAMKKEI